MQVVANFCCAGLPMAPCQPLGKFAAIRSSAVRKASPGPSSDRHGRPFIRVSTRGVTAFIRCGKSKPERMTLSTDSPEPIARKPAIWDHLSHAGRRVAILDVPLSGPSRAVNGIQTIEYGGHDAHLGFQTTPASLAEELVSKFGPPTNHPVSGNCSAEENDCRHAPVFRQACRKCFNERRT